ncbi:hypothetical protein [Xanthobacter sp. 126]|uniref:hypothetical protein n=1 Tax=Xanthobacter sp. 126 TaxID=1131814 RepID=UPI00045E5B91|nr:hypothetical protein [Xanthobacter sp. 126]
MSSDACTHNMQAPEERGVATAAPFPAHLARPSNIPRFADAQVTPPREGTLVEELSRVLANIGRFGTSQEHI